MSAYIQQFLKVKSRKKVFHTLQLFTLLVYFGFKDAYLVDCCSLSQIEASKLLQAIVEANKLLRSVLCIVPLGVDIIIANIGTLKAKISDSSYQPLLVALEGDVVRLCDSNETLQTLSAIAAEVTKAVDNIKKGVLTINEAEEFSLPCFAGWLLSYSSLYNYVSSNNSNHNIDSSSENTGQVVELKKFSINLIAVQLFSSTLTGGSVAVDSPLEATSFSMPLSIAEGSEAKERIELLISLQLRELNNMLSFYNESDGDSGVDCRVSNFAAAADLTRMKADYKRLLSVSGACVTSEVFGVTSINL